MDCRAFVVQHISSISSHGAAITAILLLRFSFDPLWGVKLQYIMHFPAVIVAAWLGGLGPGILTTLITAVATQYFWIEPTYSWRATDASELLGLLVFVAVGVVISALNDAWRSGAAALSDSEDRLRVTLTSIGDAIITTDERGRVTRLNPVAEQLTGWSAEEATAKPLPEVLVILNEEIVSQRRTRWTSSWRLASSQAWQTTRSLWPGTAVRSDR